MSRFFSPSFNSVTQADSYTVYCSPATGLLCHISPVNLPVCQLSLSLSSRPDKYSFYWGIFHFSLSLCSSFPSLASSALDWAALCCTCSGWPYTARTSGMGVPARSPHAPCTRHSAGGCKVLPPAQKPLWGAPRGGHGPAALGNEGS